MRDRHMKFLAALPDDTGGARYVDWTSPGQAGNAARKTPVGDARQPSQSIKWPA